MKKAQTPMMMQYMEIKNQHPDEILFFRLGDFYEMFFDDAVLASQELEITLMSREGGNGTRIPMCGVPYHAAENYIARLVQKGYKIAICEQTEDPKAVKGIVKREVIKIISPGTVLSDSMLTDSGNNYLAVIVGTSNKIAVAASDVSTGECLWSVYEGAGRLNDLYNQLYRFMPSEVISLGAWEGNTEVESYLKRRSQRCLFTVKEAADNDLAALRERFAESDWPDDESARYAIDTLLAYLKDNIKTDIAHMNRLTHLDASEYLILDTFTLRNLEVTRNMKDGGKKETLYGALDCTKTAMGKRMLKKWLEYPLMNRVRIIERQDAIEELLTAPILRENLLECLKRIYDFERILTRVEVGSANARDLNALKLSLASLPAMQSLLEGANAPLLRRLHRNLETHADITALLETAIHEEPPISLRDGGIIKEGYCRELDELRVIARDSKAWISDFEQK
ncbi:MAG: DNA mismatch repair protein MutS, partial [Selenomonadales bacterium]|nr:DNA mismatch repair protein MutS [Selenomonadales bacterium]